MHPSKRIDIQVIINTHIGFKIDNNATAGAL